MRRMLAAVMWVMLVSGPVVYAQEAAGGKAPAAAPAAAKADVAAPAAAKADAAAPAAAKAGGAYAKAPGTTQGAGAAEDVNPLIHRFNQGGKTMWALLALSLVGVAFTVERMFAVRRVVIAPDGFVEKADEFWKAGKMNEIRELCKKNPSTLGRMINFVVEHRDNPLQSLNEAISEIARREFRKHNRRVYPLSVIGTLSPLLGLFGTVVGLLDAFEAVAVAGTMDDPSILSGSIALALITTIYGLLIAMPALMIFHFFKSKTGDLLDILDESVSTLMNNWYVKKTVK